MDHHILLQLHVLLYLTRVILVPVLIVIKGIPIGEFGINLNRLLVRLLLFFPPHSQFVPFEEKQSNIVQFVVGVKQSSHTVQQFLIIMQIFLFFDFVQFKLVLYVFILECWVAP